uniref:Ribosomal protein S11 n=1 Tax=Hepatozoon canis TaxID=110120 RepID=A0A3S8TEU0_9APIC|nr:ribosomal protein S11 [Hepatozoon canis]
MVIQYYLYINFKKNNIIMTLTNKIFYLNKYKEKTLKTVTSGVYGIKNKQKNTPFSCLFMLKQLITVKVINLILKGESCLKNLVIDYLTQDGVRILSIYESTITPYNGCKYSNKKILNEYKN